MSDVAPSDRVIALTLGAATIFGMAAGLGVWLSTPRQLQFLSYGLFGSAAVVFLITLVLAGVAIATPRPGPSDGGNPPSPDDPISPAPGKVPTGNLDYELEQLLSRS